MNYSQMFAIVLVLFGVGIGLVMLRNKLQAAIVPVENEARTPAEMNPLEAIGEAVIQFLRKDNGHELADILPVFLLDCILHEVSYERGDQMLTELKDHIEKYLEKGDHVW